MQCQTISTRTLCVWLWRGMLPEFTYRIHCQCQRSANVCRTGVVYVVVVIGRFVIMQWQGDRLGLLALPVPVASTGSLCLPPASVFNNFALLLCVPVAWRM